MNAALTGESIFLRAGNNGVPDAASIQLGSDRRKMSIAKKFLKRFTGNFVSWVRLFNLRGSNLLSYDILVIINIRSNDSKLTHSPIESYCKLWCTDGWVL